MKRPPFQLRADRGAQSRRPGGRLLTGRATFVWLYGVLLPLAEGLEGVEFRMAPRGGGSNPPWHRITYTADEARALIEEHYPLQRRSLLRGVDHRRARRAAS